MSERDDLIARAEELEAHVIDVAEHFRINTGATRYAAAVFAKATLQLQIADLLRERAEAMPVEHGERMPVEPGDCVRVGADYNSTFNDSEVTRIDFDTDDGTVSIVVELLGSSGIIIADMFLAGHAGGRRRIHSWKKPA